MLHALLAGVCGAFLAGDIFNLYVWFEIMLIASLALLVLGGSPAQLDGAVRYAALSLIATTLLLSGIGLLYGLTGTLNMADLHLRVQEVEDQGLLTLVAMVFIIAFGLKAAVFPLFFWLPASYHTPQTAVFGRFPSGLLTKVGVLRADAFLHADLPARRRVHARAAALGGGLDDGHRCSRGPRRRTS